MKKFTFLLLLTIISLNGQAQITIDQVNMTLDITGDTLFMAEFNPVGIALPQSGADMIWDYSSTPIVNTKELIYEEANNPLFPNSNIRLATSYTLVGAPIPVSTHRYMTFDAQGLSFDGTEQFYVPIPLGSFTGNPADSLFNLGGARTEMPSWTWIDFPLNYNDTSTTNSYNDIQIVVDAPTFGLSNYIVTQRRFSTTSKDANGWGKLVLTDPTTMTPDTIEVLLQERTVMSVDTFYDAAGGLVPETLLGILGLTQGAVGAELKYYYFYTAGLNQYAMVIAQADGVNALAEYNTEIFANGLHVNTKNIKPIKVSHRVYPNPIQNHQFQLELDKNNMEDWQLEISNVLGQAVHQESVTDNISTVRLDANLNSGQYFYTVKNEEGQIVANGKLVW
ncbi:MAG: T9SS type A sorting domain-containing protein [Saprospiraceae bacterium]